MNKFNVKLAYTNGQKFKIVEFFVGAPTDHGRFIFYEVYEKHWFFWKKMTFVYKSEFEDLPIIETTKLSSIDQVNILINGDQAISKGDEQYVG